MKFLNNKESQYMKNLLSFMLILVMLFSIMIPTAFAQEQEITITEVTGEEQMVLFGAASEGEGVRSGSAIDVSTRSGPAFWTDDLTVEPEGFVTDDDGNVTISSAEGLAWISVMTGGLNGQTADTFEGKTITLTDDINLSGKLWTPIGRFYNQFVMDPYPHVEEISLPFKGVFDGNDHIISGLEMSTFPDDIENKRYGLFAIAEGATIKNIYLQDVDIDVSEDKAGNINIAVLGGEVKDSVLENCMITGNVKGPHVYGLVYMFSGSISKCAFSGTLSGDYNAVGLVGSGAGTMDQCYVNAEINALNGAKGITTAWSEGTISNCYTTGSVEGEEGWRNTGICGTLGENGVIEDCYSTMTVKGETHVGGIVGTIDHPSSVVRGCVALNDTITAERTDGIETVQGRVVGSIYYEPEVKTNYAYSGMKVFLSVREKGHYLSGIPADERMPSKKHGADITAEKLAENWPVNGWDTDIWSFETGKLPTLKNLSDKIIQTGEITGHISAASEGGWNITAFDEVTMDIPEVTIATSEEDVAALFPDELLATKDGTTAVRIPDITWESDDYDGNTVGEYTFTAVLPADGYTTSADLPTAKVKVVLKYKVIFDTNGADEIDSLEVDNGNLITVPAEPARQGFIFEGWYKDEVYTELWDFDIDTVTSSVTLHAKWSIEKEQYVYTATESGPQPTLEVTEMGFMDTFIVSISNVEGYTTYALVVRQESKQEIDFSVPAGDYVIVYTGTDAGGRSIKAVDQNAGTTPQELSYKGNGTVEEPYTMLGNFYTQDGSAPLPFGVPYIDTTFRLLNLIAGYDTEGTKDYDTPYSVKFEDRNVFGYQGDTSGKLNASITIDGSRLLPCHWDGWFRSPRAYGVVLNPSDTVINLSFDGEGGLRGLVAHVLYNSETYAERRAAATEKLQAVRDDENRVLMLHTQTRDFPGPMTYKLDVSGYFAEGDTVNINYLLGAANEEWYHGINLENDYMLAMEPIYFKNNTSAVVTEGYITFDLRNGGYFELVKPEDDNKETKYVAEFAPEVADLIYPGTIYPQILSAQNQFKVTKPDDPVKDGYNFEGWYSDKALTSQYDFEAELSQNIILYPKWTKIDGGDGGSGTEPSGNTYIVTFETGKDPDTGGWNMSIESQEVEEGDRAEDPGFARSGYGYLVLGWYTDSGLTDEYNFRDEVTSDLTLYPKWMRYILKNDLKKDGGSGTESDPYLAHLADSRQSKIAWKALNELAGESEWWKVYVTEDNDPDEDLRYQWVFNGEDIEHCNIAQPYYTDIDFSKKQSNSVQVDFEWRTAIEGKVLVSIDVSKYFKDDTEVEISYVEDSCDGIVVHTDINSDDYDNTGHLPSSYYTTSTAQVDDGLITLELTHGGSFLLKSEDAGMDIDEKSRVSVKIQREVEARNGTADFSVDDEEIASAVESSIDMNADAIVIAPKVKGEADRLRTKLSKAALAKIIDKTKSDLVLETDITNVDISQDILSKIVAKDGNEFTIDVEKVSEEKVKVEIKLNNDVLKTIGNIKIGVPAKGAGQGMVAVLVNEDGSEKIIKKSVLKDSEMLAMIDGSATVKLVDKTRNFDDVDDSFWGKDAVGFATSRELFLGVSENEFGTNEAMTRSMFATVLHRLEDAPQSGDISFEDVDEDSWYGDAVAWAAENEIVKGTGDNFNPQSNITREQIALMLYRYADSVGVDTGVQGDVSQFNDGDEISDWASESMDWIVGTGLIKGKDGNVLDPSGNATRTEVAAILQRFISSIIM